MVVNLRDATHEMIQLVKEAARKEILPRFGNTARTYKKFKEPVTEADIRASLYILERIRRRFPGSYSEEHLSDDRFFHDVLWVIDPLDGTDEFLKQINDGYAMHAALLQRQPNGKYSPIVGIDYLPGVDELWYNDGHDVHFVVGNVEKAIPVPTRDKLRGYMRGVDPNPRSEKFYRMLGKRLGLPVEIVLDGGTGASVSDLLKNEINVVVFNYNHSKEWDLAMAEPLVRTRGGFICDLAGNEFTYNRQDQLNRNGYVISIVFRKEEIIPNIPEGLLIRRR